MPLNIQINIEPDERGVYDGRELARHLVLHAYAALTPYVDGCGTCSDALFNVIANRAISDILEDAREHGDQIRVVQRSIFPEGPEKEMAEAAHLADEMTAEETACLLRQAEIPKHVHDWIAAP